MVQLLPCIEIAQHKRKNYRIMVLLDSSICWKNKGVQITEYVRLQRPSKRRGSRVCGTPRTATKPEVRQLLREAMQERSWGEFYLALLAYKKKFGNCHVSVYYRDDLALGRWCRQQKTTMRSKLTSTQKRLLIEIGLLAVTSKTKRSLPLKVSPVYKKENCQNAASRTAVENNASVQHKKTTPSVQRGRRLSPKKLFVQRVQDQIIVETELSNATKKGIVDRPANEKTVVVASPIRENENLVVGAERTTQSEKDVSKFVVPQDVSCKPVVLSSPFPSQAETELPQALATLELPNLPKDWLESQLEAGRQGKLHPSRAEFLARFGVGWHEDEAAWVANFQKVVKYYYGFYDKDGRLQEIFTGDASSIHVFESFKSWLTVQFILLEQELLPRDRYRKILALREKMHSSLRYIQANRGLKPDGGSVVAQEFTDTELEACEGAARQPTAEEPAAADAAPLRMLAQQDHHVDSKRKALQVPYV